MSNELQYTVVRHSGFGYGGNPQFVGGLESVALSTKPSVRKVQETGGRVFDNYIAAEDFAEFVMYYRNSGLIPSADFYGGFSKHRIDGLQIFQPTDGINRMFDVHEGEQHG